MFKIETRRSFLTALLSGAATAALCGAPSDLAWASESRRPAGPAKRPNIVVILADDMGFSDIGCFGGEVPTPNIDALAAAGLSFTQFYNCARCSPSRASLLTGTYPHQAGMGHLETIVVPGSEGLHGRLENRVVTIAEVLKPAGYFTAMAGKWHLGMSHGVGPWQRGFQRSIASPFGELYYPDESWYNGRTVAIDGRIVPSNSPEVGKDEWYSADLFVDWSTKFIDEARAQHRPFLLYLPFVNVHFPLMAPEEDVARFKGKYMQGWDKLRRARFERQKKLGVIAQTETLPDRLPNTYDWEKLSPKERDDFDTIMATYAACLARMDRAVGVLVERLRARGELDNTLILFMSDNGGNAELGPDGVLGGAGRPGGPKSMVFADMNWATLMNTPFQYFKHFVEEGGIATPLIAHWPAGIDKHLEGSFVRTPGHFVDVMPTLAEVAGATYPAKFNGSDIIPAQGRSMAPAFRGRPLTRNAPIFWEHEGNRAVRDGDWKLVSLYKEPWRLFNMAADRSETNDLSASFPARAAKMAANWEAWAKASYVDPWKSSYDKGFGGHDPQNWGGVARPKHPEAMDRMTPALQRFMQAD